jgi:O-antigen/teichoic acid export membrane protein
MHMLGVGGVSNAASRAIELVIGRMLGLASLGLFTRASALNNVLWGNIHTLFTKVVFSSMAEEWRNTGSIRDIYLKTADLVTATLWPAFAGLAVISGPVVHLLYGDKWVDAGPILAIFAIAAIILTANTMTWEVFVVCERTGEQAKIEVARAVLALLSTTIGCFFSIGGAALGRVADASVAYAMYRRRLNELTDTHTSEILSIYARNSALTLVAIAPAVITMSIFSWDPRTPLGWISAGIAVGVVLWALASRYLNQTLAYELSWMLGRVRGRLGILRA